MATWQELSEEAPELAGRALERFEAHRHKTMATLRRDGAPRISGTEAPVLGGRLNLGGMPGVLRFADLRRDPRVAVHSGSEAPERWTGDAKVSGVAVEVLDPAGLEAFRAAAGEVPPGPFELFTVDLHEVSVVRLTPDQHLVVELWRPRRGVTAVQRG